MDSGFKGALLLVLILITTFGIGVYADQRFTPAPKPKHIVMPTHLDVNGIGWIISRPKLVNGSTTLDGNTECATRHIYIMAASEDPQTALMHELTHAMVCVDAGADFGVNNLFYNSKTNQDHEGIYRFTGMWSELLQRNPDLALYLGQQETN